MEAEELIKLKIGIDLKLKKNLLKNIGLSHGTGKSAGSLVKFTHDIAIADLLHFQILNCTQSG